MRNAISQTHIISPVIVEPPYVPPPSPIFAWLFLLTRIAIPMVIVFLLLRNSGDSLKRKLVISVALITIFALSFFLENIFYGDINVLRPFPRNESPNYVYPEFT